MNTESESGEVVNDEKRKSSILDELDEMSYKVSRKSSDISNITRQLYVLGQLTKDAPPEVLPKYFSKTSTMKQNRSMREKSTSLRSKSQKKTLKKIYKTDLKLRKTLDKQLQGTALMLPAKQKKLAQKMGFDGVWSLKDLITLKIRRKQNSANRDSHIVSFYFILKWLQELCAIIQKLHKRDICIDNLSLETIFVNRSLEVYVSNVNEVNSEESYRKELDLFLIGVTFFEACCLYYRLEFDFEGSSLQKIENLERKYIELGEDNNNLQELIFLTNKELKSFLELVETERGAPLPEMLADLIIQNCSPASLSRRKTFELIECLETILVEEVAKDEKSNIQVLQTLLSTKRLENKIIHLSETISQKKVDSLLPVYSNNGLFDADISTEPFESKSEVLESLPSNDSYFPQNNTSSKVTVNSEQTPKTQLRKLQNFFDAANSEIPKEEDAKSEAFGDVMDDIDIETRKRARSLDRGYEKAIQKDLSLNEGVEIKTLSRNEAKKALATLKVEPSKLGNQFDLQKLLSAEEAIAIVRKATILFQQEPNLLRVKAPVNIVGDIHGQYYDLRNMINLVNGKTDISASKLFLGDYVDRGAFSCEVLLYLFALKIKAPDKIWLLRGNHESRIVSSHFGFKEECLVKYGARFFNACALAFQSLPIGAVVETALGNWFCTHGGISMAVTDLNQFTEVDRFSEPALNGFLCDVLWADPVGDDLLKRQSANQFMRIEYTPNYTRGCSCRYGFRAVKKFLEKNDLVGIIRAHEVQEAGYKLHFKQLHSKKNTPIVLTLFSAPHYCGRYNNKAAFITLEYDMNNTNVTPSLGSKIYSKKGRLRDRKDANSSKTLFTTVTRTIKRKKKIQTSSKVPDQEKKGLPLEIVHVTQFDAVTSPMPVQFESAHYREELNIQAICPYIATDCASFVLKAIELIPSAQGVENITLQEEKQFQEIKPPKLRRFMRPNILTKSGRSWKALHAIGFSENSLENTSEVASEPPKVSNTPRLRYDRAASMDSINEMNPLLMQTKFESARSSFNTSIKNIPKEIYITEGLKSEETDTEGSLQQVKFTKKEILAIKALFLLVDRREKGEIDAEDLLVWAQDFQYMVNDYEVNLCIQLLAENKLAINFQDFLLFASKCKKDWIKRKIEAIKSEGDSTIIPQSSDSLFHFKANQSRSANEAP